MKQGIRSFTLQDGIFEELLNALVVGEITPGENITVKQVADRFKVSPMPAREALRRLESKGFIKVGHNRRLTVRRLSADELQQIVEIRLVLEVYAARKASQNRSEESVQKLEEILVRYSNAVNAEERLEINREFHHLIYQEAKLPLLVENIDLLWERASPYLAIDMRKNPRIDKMIDFHRRMLEGMREKNPTEVKKWIQKDITNAADRVLKHLI
jgi:DNA-binding GntR family transcriptional regulator